MEKNTIVQIRKKGGLESLKFTGGTVQAKLYSQTAEEKMAGRDGTLEGDYKDRMFPGAKHFLAPFWSKPKSRWNWGGTPERLVELIRDMKLRFPKGHDKEGTFISDEEKPAEARLTYFHDDVFRHPSFYGRDFMEYGRINLGTSDPVQAFLALCYKGNIEVEDKSSGQKVNKYIAGSQKYEMISPKAESKTKKESIDKEYQATTLLRAMDGNEDRLRATAEVMDLPGYDENSDTNGTFILLDSYGVKNTDVVSKYGKSGQDRFIEVASMTNEDLETCSKIMRGKNLGVLRKRQGHYLMADERLDHIDTDIQLISFFRNPANQKKYLTLLDLIEVELMAKNNR